MLNTFEETCKKDGCVPYRCVCTVFWESPIDNSGKNTSHVRERDGVTLGITQHLIEENGINHVPRELLIINLPTTRSKDL